MRAFLKRRWFLLSCLGWLMACTVTDTIVRFDGTVEGRCGFKAGNLFVDFNQPDHSFEMTLRAPQFKFHAVKLGNRPRYFNQTNTNGHSIIVSLPVLIPLAAVLSWIFIRELRWREKRAKAKDTA